MMAKAAGLVLSALVALAASEASAQPQSAMGAAPHESPRIAMVELRIGTYMPLVDRELALKGATPYTDTFGSKPMLMGELEVDRELWQELGTFSVGVSVGYAEKYASATIDDSAGGTVASAEHTALFVLPIKVLAVYRFDYAALHWGVPLVPYAKLGLVYTPWWTQKGSGVEAVDTARGAGGKWGYSFSGGLSFLLDVLEPRFAKDFDTDLGVNHSFVFAEFVYEDVNNFGGKGLDFSSRRFMFGLSFEF